MHSEQNARVQLVARLAKSMLKTQHSLTFFNMMDDEEDLRAATDTRKKAKKSKAPPKDDDLAEEDDPPVEVPKKKPRKRKEPEPEPEPEPEEEEEEVEESKKEKRELTPEEVKKKKAKDLRNSREHKKCGGFRRLSKQAGYNRSAGTAGAAQGVDMFRSCLTKDDAKRLLRYFPEVTKDATFEKEEAVERAALSSQAVPPAVAREAQAFLEPVFRACMNEALTRAVEDGINGKARVAASHMYSALRKYAPYMRYTAVLPPRGLIKHAVKEGELSKIDADDDTKAIAKEKEEVSAINKDLKRLAAEAKEKKKLRDERIAQNKADKEKAAAAAQ